MWNLKVAAYCRLSNHYHLLLHTPDANIPRCMRHINGVYTQRYNRLKNRQKTDKMLTAQLKKYKKLPGQSQRQT